MSADASAAKEEPELRNRKTGETVPAADAKTAAAVSKSDPGDADKKAAGADLKKYMPKDMSRIQKLIHGAKGSAPSALQPYIEKFEPFLAAILWALTKIIPIYLFVFDKIEELSAYVPADLLTSIIGFIVCFFGGMFPTVIAAAEAWNVAGGEYAQKSLSIMYEQFKAVREENKKDDARDDDGDGIADVDQVEGGDELVKRKMHLFMTTIEPKTTQDALSGVYTGWIGVIATLKLQFAKVIALGAAIGKLLQKPAEIVFVPIMTRLMPEDYHPWIEVIIGTVCKSIAISFAWTIQRVISAFHSAIRGGLMFARGVLRYANTKGWVKLHEDDSMLDEYCGWAMAALGFYFQFKLSFTLPWILSIVLWPFSVAEWYIVWTISE